MSKANLQSKRILFFTFALLCSVLFAGLVRRFKQCVVLLQLQLNEFKRYYGLLIWRKRVYRVCVKNKAYAHTYREKKNTKHIENETKCKSSDQNGKKEFVFIAEKCFSSTKDENEIKVYPNAHSSQKHKETLNMNALPM